MTSYCFLQTTSENVILQFPRMEKVGGTYCVGVVDEADVVSVKGRSDEDESAFLDVVALITDDASELIVVAKESETIDGMFSERYVVAGAGAIISVAVEPIVASVNTVAGVVAVPFTVSIAVVLVDEVAVGVADLVDPMSRVFVDDVLIVSDATVDVIAVMTEAVDGVIPLVFVVVTALFGVITVDA